MQDSIQTAPAPVTQAASIPSSVPAPTQAYQSAQVPTAQPSYQTPSAPQVAPEAPQAPAAPQANPWQEAFNRLSDSLSGTRNSQPQAAYSTPTPQAAQPVPQQAWASAPAAYQAAPSVSGLQTSIPQATPAYSQAPTQAPSYSSEQTAAASDEYLASVSDESLEVLQHFGLEAPALLNRYSCVVEDALLAQAQQTAEVLQQVEQLSQGMQTAQQVIDAAAEDNAAYHVMLTNPDMLAAYVDDFFGPEGPYPTELAEDRLRAEVEANEARFTQPQQAPVPQAPAYQRPEIDMPQPGVQAGNRPDDFWAQFSAMSERNPQAAWQMLSQAGPDALRSKVLVSEG